MRIIIHIEPIGKPRQTQRDKWMKRPAVMRYRAFADILRLACRKMPKTVSVLTMSVFISMPDSWSKKKKVEMKGEPHKQRPDVDNIFKGVCDALFDEDSHVWCGYMSKRWDDGKGARIEISYD